MVYVQAILADAVGRAKIFNSKQYNGYYGCLHCQNPGIHINKTHCYPGINPIKRTKDDYDDHVKLSGNVGYKGIHGPSFASDFINLPDDAYIGDMHLIDEGCIKQFCNLFFLPKHHRSPFYLLRHINNMDKRLKLVKYPTEIKRIQRSLLSYIHFNANEFRTLGNYALIYILQNEFQDVRYYNHLVKYILFIRLLRQDFVSDIDNSNSQILINSFLSDFPTLYGTRNLSYNMHANIHLPEQVALHGSLNIRNEYPGENCFKEFILNYHGTTNIEHQIAENVTIKSEIHNFLTPEQVEKIEKPELKEFYYKLHDTKHSNKPYLFQFDPLLIKPHAINCNDLGIEKRLLIMYFGEQYLSQLPILTSTKLYYNRKCKL